MLGSTPQGVLHEVLEGRWCITEPKGHMGELVEPQVTHSEGGILLGPWHHFDLPEPTLEIHCREMCSTCHAL